MKKKVDTSSQSYLPLRYRDILLGGMKTYPIHLKDFFFRWKIFYLMLKVSILSAWFEQYTNNFSLFTFALAGCLHSNHHTHAQLSSRNGKFVFSGMFHLLWVAMGQGILLYCNIFLNKSGI